ncbi:hypothetical protein HN51_059888 [Arachis hypogaea]|uniref:Uncharacterized protein n=1 Tax=Arachis hypogaea TaxID=3818 RepID=A0A444X7J7_ARAHY|nr:uncharacterized protein DDB_G0292186-like [Arachis ipaensis]QHN83393.1 uncharacterized protein DS421_20g704400 [Arachis hypogaea]RYQ85675.1 hypothetical protein Ahy_B10g105259 [Arachis hypogaea]
MNLSTLEQSSESRNSFVEVQTSININNNDNKIPVNRSNLETDSVRSKLLLDPSNDHDDDENDEKDIQIDLASNHKQMMDMNLSQLEQSFTSRNSFVEVQTNNNTIDNKIPLNRSNLGTDSVHSKLSSEPNNDHDNDDEDIRMNSASNHKQILSMNSSPLEQSSTSKNPFVEVQTSNDNNERSNLETNSLHSKLPLEPSNGHDIRMDSDSNHGQISSNPTPNKGLETQNPPIQIMERSGDSATAAAESSYSYSYSSSSFSSPSSYRVPSNAFTSNKPSTQWSTLSNESLFSIPMGNMSFTRDLSLFSKSGELDSRFIGGGAGDIMVNMPSSNNLALAPLPPLPQSSQPHPQPQSQPQSQPQASRFTDMSLRATEQQKGWRVTEEKAAETMREVIMEESLRNENFSVVDEVPYPVTHCDSTYSNNGSTKSFAFKPSTDKARSPSLKHGVEEKRNQQQQLLEQKNIVAKETPPKSNTNPSEKKWLSCFACCK